MSSVRIAPATAHFTVTDTSVLPPISTIGLTSDDVSSLAESIRELMLKTLIEISRPGPGLARVGIEGKMQTGMVENMDDLKNLPGGGRAIDTSAGGTGLEGSDQEQEQERERGADEVSTHSQNGEYSSTEDEMDEDAVLMKRPSVAGV